MQKTLFVLSAILLAALPALADEGSGKPDVAAPVGSPSVDAQESGEPDLDGSETGRCHGGAGEGSGACGQGHGGQGHGAHHRFDDPERWAERWNSAERDAWQQPDRVIGWMEIEPDMVVADIGTGTGYFTAHLATAVGPRGRVLCLDVEQSMVDFVNQRIADEGLVPAEARVVPFDDPQFEPGSIDRVLTVNTWHHIADREAYARRLLSGLAEGGTVTIVEYDMEAEEGPPREMRMEPEEVIAELEAAGFEAEVVGTLPRQYVVRAHPAN